MLQENAFHPFNSELGYGNFADVITDLQFERMLAPTGPTSGLVVSTLNGEIPGRIAIVQGHPEGDETHLLSSLVLGVNESILVLDKTNDLQVVLVSPICQSFKDKFLSEARKITGLQMIEGSPESVVRGENSSSLTLTYSENGDQKQDAFDLVIILTKPKISSEIQTLSQKLDQEVL